MTEFRVWAPRPARVELVLGWDAVGAGERRPMQRGERGWWSLEVAAAGPGTDYGFELDGEGPFPDPRSPFQPAGVHGPSRTVDHGAFPWTDGGWRVESLADAVFYELHVGTFSAEGTFEGAIEHLDAVADLGVTHVELMPVGEFPGRRGWGYDGVDLYAPHHAYGGPDGLRRLVDACHARSLAVVIDVVYNHLGPDGNYLSRFGPYFSHRYTTPWGDAVNFDGPGSDEVRSFVMDNARMWIHDYHVDGLRLDAVHEIFDQSAVHILEELATIVHAAADGLERPVVVVAESDLNNPRLVQQPDAGGYGLDAQWNDDYRHALHTTLTGETDAFHGQYRGIPDLATALRRVFVFDGRYSPFRDRRHGRPVRDVPATSFVAFAQNHDQVGNRALGERLAQLVGPDRLRVAAAFVVLGPFVPLLFAGEEWGASSPFQYFTDHQDPDLAEAVRRGRAREFAHSVGAHGVVPDPQDPATFERSRLRWSERSTGPNAALLDWYRRLIAFRRDHPGLRDGTLPSVRCDEEAGWITAERGGYVVAANLSAGRVTVPLEAGHDGMATVALASADGIGLAGDRLDLPPWSVAVIAR